MKLFKEHRLVYQQAPATPEQQTQPPVETGKEALPINTEVGKEALPASGDVVSNEYKDKAKQQISSASNKLDVFQNLKTG